MKHNFTLVTGLWDLGRETLDDFKRPFEEYLSNFEKLLTLDFPMCVFVPGDLEKFVNERRSSLNTKVYIKNTHDFRTWFEFYPQIQRIRNDPNWYNQADWLSKSPQANLEYYNAILMSRFFMLNDITIHNPFNTKYFFTIDGGLTNTVSLDSLKNLENIESYMESINDKFLYLSFPYETESEVHGFKSDRFNEYCGVEKTTYVCRGGFHGGTREKINQLNGDYYGALSRSLNEGLMGADECIHTIVSYNNPKLIHRYELPDHALVFPFFDNLANLKKKKQYNDLIPYNVNKSIEDIKTSLYVLTYNSPEQFRILIESFAATDMDFLNKPRKILVDNSTDPSLYLEYNSLCKKYGFEHIKKETNVGICGGRQFVAEHFIESDSEYYIFFEDDMKLNPNKKQCRIGYNTFVDNLYYKSLSIIHKNNYDFLKLSYSEFFGDNSIQWAWYNIPQTVREEFFPDNHTLPENGLSDNVPKIIPKQRNRFKGLSYLEGDYHYCNWPIWFSRKGNRKVFLDIKWDKPHEQTWMSNVFQLQKENQIKSAILELSPIDHHRFDFYPREERIES